MLILEYHILVEVNRIQQLEQHSPSSITVEHSLCQDAPVPHGDLSPV